ncbi:WD40 repeat domain-containing protein [Candidatus Poribacteria bacterium]|nr:WD40 repeat domain-containing protein [Candidatus Poribacteria bacterium]
MVFLDDGKTLVGEGLIDKISHDLIGGDPWRWEIPKVWMWDAHTGKRLDSFTTELPKFNSLKDARFRVEVKAFADSTRVIFAFENKDGTISVKDGRTNREITTLPKPKWEVRAFSFTPDGRMLAIATSKDVHLWDLETGKQVLTFQKRVANFNGNPVILTFSKDGKTLAVAGLDDIEIWNMDTYSQVVTLKNKDGGLWEFVLSADGATVVTMNHHGTVDLWSARTGKHEGTLTTGWTSRFSTLVFSHDGKTIASSTGSKIHLWDTNTCTEKLRMQLPGRIEGVNKHIEPNLRAAVPMVRGSEIASLAFSDDNTTLATFTVSDKVEIWDVSTGQYNNGYPLEGILRRVPHGPLTDDLSSVPVPRTSVIYYIFATSFERSGYAWHTAVFSPNSEKLAVKNQNDIVEVWDVLTQRRLCTLVGSSPNWSAALVFTLAFTQDSEVLAVGEGTDIHLSNTDTGKTFATFSVSKKKLNLIDKLQKFLGLKGFDVPVGAVALGRAGEPLIVAAGAGKTIHLWEVATRKSVTLEGHTSEVCKLAFSPNATFLASGDIDGTIHLWLLPAGHKLATFKPYMSPVKELVFAPDGKTLASTNLHSRFAGTILLWDVPPK